MGESVEIQILAVDAATSIIQKIGDAFGPFGAAAATGIGLAVGAMTDLIKAGSEEEDTMARFNALLSNSYVGYMKDQMLQFADAESKVTVYAKDNIVAAEGQLALYKNIGSDIFPQVSKATLDLASFMGTDAKSAATMLGKSFEDLGGSGAALLMRQKLLTQEQNNTAKEMANSNNVAGAQAYVLNILQGEIGGMAEKMGSAGSGPMTILNNKLQDLKEGMGSMLVEKLNPLISRFSDFVSANGPAVIDMFGKIITQVEGTGERIYQFLLPAFTQISTWWAANGPQIQNTVKAVMDSLGPPLLDIATHVIPVFVSVAHEMYSFIQSNGPEMNKMFKELGDIISNHLIPVFNALMPILEVVLLPFIKETEDSIKMVETLIDWFDKLLGKVDQPIHITADMNLSGFTEEQINASKVYYGFGGAGYYQHASGGSFLIPESYGNEGFRMGNGDTASGGERVTITPRGQATGGGGSVIFNFNVGTLIGNKNDVMYLVNEGIRLAQADGRLPSGR